MLDDVATENEVEARAHCWLLMVQIRYANCHPLGEGSRHGPWRRQAYDLITSSSEGPCQISFYAANTD